MSNINVHDHKRNCLTRKVKNLVLKGVYLGMTIGCKSEYKFRHTFAVRVIIDNVTLNVVQQWLGHSSVFTTSIYTQITGMDTSEFMERVR